MDVDEAGRNGQSADIECQSRRVIREVADGCDPVTAYRDIGDCRFAAIAGVDFASHEHDIERLRARTGAEGQEQE
jgi:hypothetical protein